MSRNSAFLKPLFILVLIKIKKAGPKKKLSKSPNRIPLIIMLTVMSFILMIKVEKKMPEKLSV